MFILIIKLLLVAFSLLITAVTTSPADRLAARKCKTYTPSSALYQINSQIFYASAALFCDQPGTEINAGFSEFGSSCSPTNSCVIGNDAINIPVQPTLNLSLSSTDENDVYVVVAGATGLDFTAKVNSTVDAGISGFCLSNNTGRVVTVQYGLNCTNGTLSSCDGNTPAEGTAIQACAPSTFRSSNDLAPILLFSSQNVTQDQARNITVSPIAVKSASSRVSTSHFVGIGIILFAISQVNI
jgi:hypothetical protein